MSKKLRIGCFLCAVAMLFICSLSGCMETESVRNDDDDHDNTGNNNSIVNNTGGNNSTSGANSNNNGTSQKKTIPSTFDVELTLQAENYFWMRDYENEGHNEDMPSGTVNYYRYVATRFYDEYGNLHPFNYSESLESLMDRDDYEALELIDIIYIQFDSASSAHNTFVELLDDDIIEGAYNTSSGSNWERAWQYFSVETCNTLVCRIDNVVCLIYAEWDDFDDAGIAYDNAAIKAMEQIGF